MPPPDAETLARRMPKVLLHEHLDGGLRVATLFELLQQRGPDCPAPDVPSLAAWFNAHAHAGSLEQYLQGFALSVAAMADPVALERVAFEAAEDARADGCVLAEFRIAPLLFDAHGLDGDTVVAALLAGLRRSPLPSGLIVCAMRHLAPAETMRAAELALRWQGRGVIGFDLAGAEAGYPPVLHAGALKRLRDAGLPLTLHAGEADVGARVLEAADHGAVRIGHGVHVADALGTPEGDALAAQVRARGLHLEVCPTSNVHTGAYASLAAHPITALWRAGIACSFHTDNRLMSVITMADEAANLVRDCALTPVDLTRMTLGAAQASFLPADQRNRAADAVKAWAVANDLSLSEA